MSYQTSFSVYHHQIIMVKRRVSRESVTKNNITEYMTTSLLFHENKYLIFLLNKLLWYSLYIWQKNEWKMNSNFTS